MKIYLFTYVFNGESYEIQLHANSVDEAKEKMRWLKMSAVYTGEVMLTIPVPGPSWFKELFRWIR